MKFLLLIILLFSDVPKSYRKGVELYNDHKFEEAEGCFKDFITTNKDDTLIPNALYYLATLEKDGEKAFFAFMKIYIKYYNSQVADDALLRVAKYHYAKGEFKNAVVRFEELIGCYKNSDLLPEATYHLSTSCRAIGESKKANANFRKIIRKYPNSDYAKLAEEELPPPSYKYAVQIKSYKRKKNAERLGRKIKELGYKVVIAKKKNTYYIRAGYFESEEEAQKAFLDLKDKGFKNIYILRKRCRD